MLVKFETAESCIYQPPASAGGVRTKTPSASAIDLTGEEQWLKPGICRRFFHQLKLVAKNAETDAILQNRELTLGGGFSQPQ
jgi:hypothetical protein